MINVEPTRIPKEDLENHCNVLVVGNVKLKHCAELAGMNQRKFRGRLFKADMRPEKLNLSNKVVMVVNQSLPSIRAVQALEWTMFTGFIRVAWNIASRISRWGVLEYEDAEQEAYAALVDSIYGYSKPGVKFKTFVWKAIQNRLLRLHNRTNPLSPLSNNALAVMALFEAERSKMNCNGPVRPEEVMDRLNLSEKDRTLVTACLGIRVVGGYDLGRPDDDEGLFDYSTLRVGAETDERFNVKCHFEIREAMHRASLTEVERQVLEASLEPYYGWLTDMAEKTINPDTSKPYTKRGIGVILTRALAKVRQSYERPERMVG